MITFTLENHEPSFLPDGKWSLVWNDEFDGTELDRNKWDYRLCMMQKRHPAWVDDAVKLDGESHAVFTAYKKDDGTIVSSQLQTGYNFADAVPQGPTGSGRAIVWPIGKLQESKFLHRYGYYECRCRLQRNPGWWSAFWLQSPIIGTSLDPAMTGIENDIMESFEPGKVIFHTNIFGGYGVDYQERKAGNGLDVDTSVFHRFGMLWEEDGYTFYVDGKEDGRITEPVSHVPQFILISTEVQGYRRGSGKMHDPEAINALTDSFVVDYVRVFDRV